ncbi:hypothetical protein DEU56DRAFT_386221 [Suillus clintonianus]|uniref:uncharacterized protein n=1 Tax=Suillus clintonianus TaxID=1904413 RepID=UPI001B87C86D|nr:uncharacterized protein DEU56DRAFT_386221 [Suillus clintonianus]KAG2154873.1 hypothetical protein DEU56DRAFT_386221 [Suillus clintonianus]
MTYRATDDLQGYLKDAVLPRLKLMHKPESMFHQRYKSRRSTLTVGPRHRNLANIVFLDSAFDGLVNDWIEEHVPNRSLCLYDEDRQTGERFTVRSSQRFNVPELLLPAASDINRVCDWLDNFPLQTVQRVFHIMFPATKDWGFTTLDDDGCDDNFKKFYWTDENQDHADIRDASVIVACQPSWIMSDEFMWQFTQLKSLPEGTTRPLRGKERLWGKLWDTCVHNQTPFFVLTSYQQWVFGMFSRGWTTVFVSPVIDAQSRSPTVMHALLYWLGSALGAPGGFVQPVEVAEPVQNILDRCSGLPIAEPEKELEIAPSLSSWSGKSDEVASSAGAANAVALDVSDRGVDEPYGPDVLFKKSKDPALTLEMIESWRKKLPTNRIENKSFPSPTFASSVALLPDLFDDSAASDTSDETVGVPRGHWLMSASRR